MGKPDLYNKPYLKICFYSALFSGGAKAMIEGVVESEAKQAGMTTAEFKRTKDFEGVHIIAKQIASYMERTTFVTELINLYNYAFDINEGGEFVGPTGRRYTVTDRENFRKVFPNLLQSYEFAILGQSTLNTIEKFPGSQLFYHFHDGNVIAVKATDKEMFLKELNVQVSGIGESLDLKFPQQIDLQATFGE